MTEREQFEAWAKSKGAPKDGWWIRQLDDGGYSCHAADMAWEAWQAARAHPAQAGAEPVAWVVKMPGGYHDCGYDSGVLNKVPHGTMLYTHPPARVPLTDGEINDLRQKHGVTSNGQGIKEWTQVADFARAVIAAYEAKNGIGGGK